MLTTVSYKDSKNFRSRYFTSKEQGKFNSYNWKSNIFALASSKRVYYHVAWYCYAYLFQLFLWSDARVSNPLGTKSRGYSPLCLLNSLSSGVIRH